MASKIKNWLKLNYINILLFIIIFIIIAPCFLVDYLNDLDEIWNYSFAKNIADGLVPYRDFNMLQTPSLPFITALFLCVFGNELIISRILGIFLISFIFFILYLILKKLKVNNFYILFCLFCLFCLLENYICLDYNFCVLAIILTLIYLEINHIYSSNYYFNKPFIYNFLLGTLMGLSILFKQSTGLVVSFISIIFPIFFIKNKMDFKKYIKTTFYKIVGLCIPIILLIIYLFFNNAIYDFIDYTILGIKNFTSFISYFNLISSTDITIKLLSILLPIFLLIIFIYAYIKKNKILIMFSAYSIASTIVVYPISDNIHFLIGFTPTIILFLYSLFNVLNYLRKKIKYNKKIGLFFYKFITCICFLFLVIHLITAIRNIIIYLNNTNKNHTIAHYKYIPISTSLVNNINEIDNYILSQNNNVYILDSQASTYMITIDRYYKDFNLFLKGNVGSKGEERFN